MHSKLQIRAARWERVRVLVLVSAGFAAFFAVLCWKVGGLGGIAAVQVDLLLSGLIVLNLLPAAAELACRRLDPFDPKHLCLVYFFLIFTLAGFCEIEYGFVRPGFEVHLLDVSTRIRALAAILLGLAAFVIGCYLPIGENLAATSPRLSRFPTRRVKFVAYTGIGSGLVAFYFLMASAGGVSSFLQNLGSWRTLGVLGGVGFLTFPISTILPSSVLLLFILAVSKYSTKLTWSMLRASVLIAVSLSLVSILGFRVTLVPIIFQFLVVWHYRRSRFRLGRLLAIGCFLAGGLSLYATFRSQGPVFSPDALSDALLFRTPGLATVERVVQRMDQGEPHRGLSSAVSEAATILMPRALWPGKPQTAGLAFDDIFFYDFYIGRGDPINGLKSGISPTIVGEALWRRGIGMVAVGLLCLGVMARALSVWLKRGRSNQLHLFIYAIFTTNLPIFFEAPQNALNSFVMLGAMSFIMVMAINLRLGDAPLAKPVSVCSL